MNIDSIQQEPHSPIERLSLFFANGPARPPSCSGPMLGRPSPPLNRLRGRYPLRGFCYAPTVRCAIYVYEHIFVLVGKAGAVCGDEIGSVRGNGTVTGGG
jgi:hypothetical protein